MKRSGRTRQQGFTLLEMLAALVVFSLGCSVLLLAFGQAARTLAQVRGSDRLSLAAASLIDEQRRQPLRPGRFEGRSAEGIAWRLQVDEQPPFDGPTVLYHLQLQVRERGREMQVSTLAARARPFAGEAE